MHDELREMPQEKMVEEFEDAFLTGKIKMQTKKDWEEFKEINLSLWKTYSKELANSSEENLPFLRKKWAFVRLMHEYIPKMEAKYQNNFGAFLTTMVYQLRFLDLYNRTSTFKEELHTEYIQARNTNGPIPFIDAKDDNTKKIYRIKKEDYNLFLDACQTQKNLYNEFVQIYTCVNKDRSRKLRLMENYNKEIEELRTSMLNGELKITTLKQWNLFKQNLQDFNKNYEALLFDIEIVENFPIFTKSEKLFLEMLSACVQNIEEKYNKNLVEKDLPMLISMICAIGNYQTLKEQQETFLASAIQKKRSIKQQGDSIQTTIVTNSNNQKYCIESGDALKYFEFSQKLENMQSEYNNAYDFIFPKNIEAVEEGKRAM